MSWLNLEQMKRYGLFLDSADATFPAKDRKVCLVPPDGIINCNLGNFGFLAKKLPTVWGKKKDLM